MAALIVPVGYALSIDSKPRTPRTVYTVIPAAATAVAAPMTMHHVDAPAALMYPVSDSAKLLFIGTILFGLAAAVRKAP